MPRQTPPAKVPHDLHDTIVSIDCFPAVLKLVKPIIMSTYRIDEGRSLFVRIRTRSGAEGWGEAAANAVMSGDTLPGMIAAIKEYLTPRLLGASPFERAALSRTLRHQLFGNGGAKTAVDMALLDLAGKIAGVPAVELLGGAVRRSATVLRLVGGSGEPGKDVDEVSGLVAAGFKAFKIKVGVAPVDKDIETVRRLSDAFGSSVLLAADANMGWDVATASLFTRGVSEYGLAFLEQPVPPGSIETMAAVARISSVPLGADEAIHGFADIDAHVRAGAIGGVSLKTIKLGGITPLVSIAHACDALGLCVNLAMLMESSLASAAMLHAAAAVPNVDWGFSVGSLTITTDPVVAGLEISDGLIHLPKTAGLGVQVDEARLRKLAPS